MIELARTFPETAMARTYVQYDTRNPDPRVQIVCEGVSIRFPGDSSPRLVIDDDPNLRNLRVYLEFPGIEDGEARSFLASGHLNAIDVLTAFEIDQLSFQVYDAQGYDSANDLFVATVTYALNLHGVVLFAALNGHPLIGRITIGDRTLLLNADTIELLDRFTSNTAST